MRPFRALPSNCKTYRRSLAKTCKKQNTQKHQDTNESGVKSIVTYFIPSPRRIARGVCPCRRPGARRIPDQGFAAPVCWWSGFARRVPSRADQSFHPKRLTLRAHQTLPSEGRILSTLRLCTWEGKRKFINQSINRSMSQSSLIDQDIPLNQNWIGWLPFDDMFVGPYENVAILSAS